MEVAAAIYRLTAKYPKNETYGMISQMRRAAVSVPSNIAEGQSRLTTGEFKHFLGIARGSLAELNTQLHVSVTLALTTPADAEGLLSRVAELGRVLNGLLRSLDENTSH